jgi:hypothetical protein
VERPDTLQIGVHLRKKKLKFGDAIIVIVSLIQSLAQRFMNGAVSLKKFHQNKLLQLEHVIDVDDQVIIRPTVMLERIKMGMSWMTKNGSIKSFIHIF